MRLSAALLAAFLFAQPYTASADESRAAIVGRFATELERIYVFADLGHAAAARVRTRAAEHAYDGLEDQAFARALTADTAAVLHDKHVHVFYNAYPLPRESDPAAPLSDA